MKRIMEYIDSSLSAFPQNKYSEKFRQNLIDEVTERANDITHAGLSDEKVIEDLIISEHNDIKTEYKEYIKELNASKNKRRNFLIKLFISVIYFLTVLCLYFVISSATKAWSVTWVLPVCSVIVYISVILFIPIATLSKKNTLFVTQTARLILPFIVFNYSTVAFLIFHFVFGFEKSWLVFIAGVVLMFVADGIYVEKTAERFAIFFHLLYIVPAFAMFYIIFAALNIIPWSIGWVMIPGSLVIVLAVIVIRLIMHNRADNSLGEEEPEL